MSLKATITNGIKVSGDTSVNTVSSVLNTSVKNIKIESNTSFPKRIAVNENGEQPSTNFINDYNIRIKKAEIIYSKQTVKNQNSQSEKQPEGLVIHRPTFPSLLIETYPISQEVYNLIQTTDRVVLRLPWLKRKKRRKSWGKIKEHSGDAEDTRYTQRSIKRFSLPDSWVSFKRTEEDRQEQLRQLFIKYHWVVITPDMIKKDKMNNYFIRLTINLFERTKNQLAEYTITVPTLQSWDIQNCHYSIFTKSYNTLQQRWKNTCYPGWITGNNNDRQDDARISFVPSTNSIFKIKKEYIYVFTSPTGWLYIPDYNDDNISLDFNQEIQRIVHNFRPEYLFNEGYHLDFGTGSCGNLTINEIKNIIDTIYDERTAGPIRPAQPFRTDWSLIGYQFYLAAHPKRYDKEYHRKNRWDNAKYKTIIRELIRPNFAILAEDWSDWECKHIWIHQSEYCNKIITIKWDEMFHYSPVTKDIDPIITTYLTYSIQDIIN